MKGTLLIFLHSFAFNIIVTLNIAVLVANMKIIMNLWLATSTKALFKGIDTWKKETMMKKVNLPYTPKILNLSFIYSTFGGYWLARVLSYFDLQEAAKQLEEEPKSGGKSL